MNQTMLIDNKPTILDTTLRDGSYVVNFQFTAQDTQTLSRALAHSGVRLIEIGHGLGINASETMGQAAATDIEYIEAARAGAPDAMIGMFCIPGIAKLDHLRACADAGMHFVRIGANVNQTEDTRAFIELGRSLGLYVCTNFMKSYALAPKEFGDVAAMSADFGSQMLYLVDSAGGMMPRDVKTYTEAILERADLPIGFHGHNNLHLAVANSLAAVEAGAQVVDTTLLGLGRSSGNAATEIIVPLLQKEFDSCHDMDALLLLEMAEKLISPLAKHRWEDTEKTALGLSQVHSMYANRIRKAANTSGRSFISIAKEVGIRDRLNLSDEILHEAVEAARSNTHLENTLGNMSLVVPLDGELDIERLARAHWMSGMLIYVGVKPDQPLRATYGEGVIFAACDEANFERLQQALPDVVLRDTSALAHLSLDGQ
ncbi:MAG TPA: hypothetical protein VIN57_01355 [Magnetovibrio sp.]